MLAFSGFFFGIALAEFLTWLGLERWISYLIVWFLLVLLAALAALVGRRFIKKIEKPERTLETLRDLPDVLHREAPGERHRDVPVVSNGKVALRGNETLQGLIPPATVTVPPDGRPDATSVLLPGPWTHRDISANGVRLHVAEAGRARWSCSCTASRSSGGPGGRS